MNMVYFSGSQPKIVCFLKDSSLYLWRKNIQIYFYFFILPKYLHSFSSQTLLTVKKEQKGKQTIAGQVYNVDSHYSANLSFK